MSLFSLFSSPGSKYSQKLQSLPVDEVKRFFNKYHWSSVKEAEEDLVEAAILSGRDSSTRISLRKIYRILRSLENKHKISLTDRKVIMEKWEEYFK